MSRTARYTRSPGRPTGTAMSFLTLRFRDPRRFGGLWTGDTVEGLGWLKPYL